MNGIKIVWRTAAAVVALLSLSLLTAGCIEELRQGGKVSFTASTGYLNDGVKGETKTLYSGDIQTSSGVRFERINWVTGDLIGIRCAQSLGQESDPSKKSAVYTVTAASSHSGTTDVAQGISPKSPDTDLLWNLSGGKHHFFAAYPSDVTLTEYKDDVIYMSHSVPAVQVVTQKTGREFVPDMTLVAMGAYSAMTPSGSTPTVDLKFRPLVTTLRVELLAGDYTSKNNNLTMLRLKSSYAPSTRPLAGTYKVALGDYENNKTAVPEFTSTSTDNYEGTGLATVSVTSSEPSTATETSVRIVPQAGTPFAGGVRLDETNATGFTFVMLPVEATNLTLELTFGGTYDATTQTVTGGTTRSLELKNSNISWSLAERRKNYLNMVEVSGPPPTLTDFTLTSSSDDAMWVGDANGITLTVSDAVYSDGSTVASPTAAWTTSNSSIATVSGASGTSITVKAGTISGQATITAQIGTVTKTFTAKVNELKSVVISEGAPSVIVTNSTPAYKATVTYRLYDDTADQTATNTAITGWTLASGTSNGWKSSDTGIATIDGSTRIATGVAVGTTTISFGLVRSNNTTDATGTTPLEVTDKIVTDLSASVPDDVKWVGDAAWTLPTEATATYNDGTTGTVTLGAWTLTSGTAATVSGSSVTPATAGQATFTASYGGKSVTFTAKVNELKEVSVSPASATKVAGQTQVFDATVSYRLHDATADVTDKKLTEVPAGHGWSAAWSSTRPAKATVPAGSTGTSVTATAVASDYSDITYTLTKGSLTKSAYGRLNVTDRTVTDFTLTSSSDDAMWVGDISGITLTVSDAAYNDGTTEASPTATWTTSNPSIATVSSASGTSITVKAGTTWGEATITAQVGSVTKTFHAKVNQLNSVTVTLSPAEIYVGGTSAATRKIKRTDYNGTVTEDATIPSGWTAVTDSGYAGGWKSSATNIATVGSTGTVTGVNSPSTPSQSTISFTIRRSDSANAANTASGSAVITVKTTGDPEAYNVSGNSGIQ